MKDNPLVSIITPTLNASSTLVSCLNSVAFQKYRNIEHIIIDGLSNDDTFEIAKKFQNQFVNIKVIREKDFGIYDAMNKGIDLAKGEWIYFLGSDDALYDDNIFFSLLPLLNNTELDIIYGNVIFKISGKKYNGKFNSLKLLNRNICHQGIITRKSVYEKLGKFDLRYNALADWHFNMKWFNDKKFKHTYIDNIIAYFFEDGYCYNNPDVRFIEDWEKNTNMYFPYLTIKIYQNKDNKVVSNLLKFLRFE